MRERNISVELWLSVIVLFSAALRFAYLGTESIWADEGWSFYYAKMKMGALVRDTFFNENNPPLYYVILNIWMKIFGDSEIAMRVPSAIFGSLLVFCNFKLGEYFYNKNTGLWCSFLSAVSLFYIEYSQEARVYMLLALLTCLSMYSYFRLQGGRSFAIKLSYVIWTVFLIYSHVYGVFILFAQNLIYISQQILFQRKGLRPRFWIYLQVIVFLFACPWLASYLIRAAHIQDGFWIAAPGLRTLTNTFRTYALWSTAGLILFLFLLVLSPFAIRPASIPHDPKNLIAKINEFKWEVKIDEIEKTIALLIWLFIPIVTPFIISLFSQPIYFIKYTIGSSIPFYLLVARGASILSKNNKHIRNILVVFILALLIPKLVGYYRNIEKEQWREAFSYIEENSEPQDLIILNAPDIKWTTYAYYQKREDMVAVGFPENTSKVEPKHLAEMEDVTMDRDRIWLVLSHSRDDENLLYSYLKNHFFEIDAPVFKGLELYHFVKNPS